jgi:hypothetical protein
LTAGTRAGENQGALIGQHDVRPEGGAMGGRAESSEHGKGSRLIRAARFLWAVLVVLAILTPLGVVALAVVVVFAGVYVAGHVLASALEGIASSVAFVTAAASILAALLVLLMTSLLEVPPQYLPFGPILRLILKWLSGP